MKRLNRYRCFDGSNEFYSHASSSVNCEMKFSVFLPPAAQTRKVPVLYWLSGLTCTEENFTTKAGAQRYAAEHQLALVAPDTSPRGEGVPTGDSWDIGLGAGFYVNATTPKWAKHYRMYDYITKELPELIQNQFPILAEKQSISGHSMGGHGALVIGLREKEKYRSVSAFSPIVAPTEVAWGHKAFGEYLGSDKETWKNYDACELVRKSPRKESLLIEQGTQDQFLSEQLRPELFQKACSEAGQPLELKMREGYDHSYYFISSFIGEHIKFHAKFLG